MATATTGMSERAAVVNAPPRNLPIWRFSSKVPSGKEHQGLAGGRQFQHAARIGRALVAVESLDELRAQAPQQQTGQRYSHHLLLDDEGKVGRQCRDDGDGIDVAGMIGHHHAGRLRQPLQPLDREGNAGHPQKGARRPCRPPRGAGAGSGRNRLTASTANPSTVKATRQ